MSSLGRDSIRVWGAGVLVVLSSVPWLVVVATFLHWAILGYAVPLFSNLPEWFWSFRDEPLAWGWTLSGAAVVAVGVAAVLARPALHPAIQCGIVILCGYAFQLSVGFSEGRGAEGIREEMLGNRHHVFADVAAHPSVDIATLYSYDELLADDALSGDFLHSKPPGLLGLYILSERVSSLFAQDDTLQARRRALATFAVWIWTLISCLVVIPIYVLLRLLFDARTGLTAGFLYVLTPSHNLIVLQADQTFFPLFFACLVLLGLLAFRRYSKRLGATTGALSYLAVYCTFPLGLSYAFIGALGLGVVVAAEDRRQALRRAGDVAISMAVGLAATALLFKLVLGYQIFARYSAAVDFHASFKGWDPGPGNLLTFALVDTVEFLFAIGAPLTLLCWDQLRVGFGRLLRRKPEQVDWVALALVVVFMLLALFGKTKAETARLWLFLLPCVCLLAACAVHTRFASAVRWVVPLLLILQVGTTLFLKRYQDYGLTHTTLSEDDVVSGWSRSFNAAELPAESGRSNIDGSGRSSRQGRNSPGFAVYGPAADQIMFALPDGNYTAEIQFEIPETPVGTPVGYWEVYEGVLDESFGERPLVSLGGCDGPLTDRAPFRLENMPRLDDGSLDGSLEVRVYYRGRGNLTVHSLKITRRD